MNFVKDLFYELISFKKNFINLFLSNKNKILHITYIYIFVDSVLI